MFSLTGQYLKGAGWDGSHIYLVNSNRHVFKLHPFLSINKEFKSIEVCGVMNAANLYETHVKSFGERTVPTNRYYRPDDTLRTYAIRTSKGSCHLFFKADPGSDDFYVSIEDFRGPVPDGFEKLSDFWSKNVSE